MIATIISRSLNDHINQYTQDMRAIQDYLSRYERDRLAFIGAKEDTLHRQHDQLQAWIASPDVECEHLDIQRDLEHYPRSGNWILGQEMVKNWQCPDVSTNPMLWISGNPGTGMKRLYPFLIVR